ncbi:oligosaccharide flippase family protein [Clostridium bornimense]|uniref:oligosaccharide flippase family protein n=1 Tax=Clostridium bornimense TaxID=1216932 RepID=UPI001C123118|nr:oligosaccharide flippase family protein [Clostridium bornimense]MBU5317882.1 oligosaccharide flippase family protein [Clostridium bornimense]
MKKNKVLSNTMSLYIMNIAKLIFPLLTLPYLTRVLSVDCYGIVSYEKALMTYMQLFVDFGFILSATKDIVKVQKNTEKIGEILTHTMLAKILLGLIALSITLLCATVIPILRENFVFTILMFIPVFLTIFLADFLFQGIEQMHILTIRFVIMRSLSTILTFILVKNDADLYSVAILDIISTFVSVIITWKQIKKLNVKLHFQNFSCVIKQLKESSVYFLSNMASTAFSALNTMLIGLFCSTTDIAFWSVAMQIVSAVQALYTPITNGIYPEMIKTKNFRLITKIVCLITPLIFIGCCIIYFFGDYILLILGGNKYLEASKLLKCFIPLLIFSFYAMLYGWPALGAIGRVKATTTTTVVTAILQVVGLIFLLAIDKFTIINLAFLRGITEVAMLGFRYSLCRNYKNEFLVW